MNKPTIILHPADDQGCGHYRIIQRGMMWNMHYAPTENFFCKQSFQYLPKETIWQENAKIAFYQRQYTTEQINHIESYKNMGIRLINDIDDLLWKIPASNPVKIAYGPEAVKSLRRSMELADVNTVSTIPLGQEVKRFSGRDSIVIPNFVFPNFFGAEPRHRLPDEKFVVVWAGSQTHDEDLLPLLEVATEMNDIEFRIIGYRPKGFREVSNIVYVSGTPFIHYENFLKTITADASVALAPLHPSLFNECKSNLKLLEYGSQALPIISSDIYPYKDNPYRVEWNKKQWKKWVELIRFFKDNEQERFKAAKASLAYARKFSADHPDNLRQVKNLFTL